MTWIGQNGPRASEHFKKEKKRRKKSSPRPMVVPKRGRELDIDDDYNQQPTYLDNNRKEN